MNNRARLLVVLGVLVVIVLCVASFFYTYKREWITEDTPETGAARYNRFLALQEMLENMGQPSTSGVLLARLLPSLKPEDTLVIGDDVSLIKPDEAVQLADWVRSGGHLVFSPMSYTSKEVPLMEQLGLHVEAQKDSDTQKNSSACITLAAEAEKAGGKPPSTELCGLRFALPPELATQASVTIGDADGLAFARVSEGSGTVSLVDDLSVISGQHLRNRAAQQFAWRLFAPNMGSGHCYLMYELVGASFWVNLFIRGWPALLASLLLILGWMMIRSQRLGPLMPAPVAHRRALLEHIQAAGEFLFRRDGGRSLHRLACAAVLARLRRRDPASAMLKDDELYGWLAQRSQLDPAHVAHAFRSPASAAAFRGCISTLARLRSHL